MTARDGVFKTGLMISAALAIGRFSGLLRDLVLAGSLGPTAAGDMAIITLTLPDVVVNLITGGAIAYVLVPEFSRCPRESARRALMQALALTGGLFVGLAVLTILLRHPIIKFVAPGFAATAIEETASLVSIALWALPFTAMSGVTTAFLQTQNRFTLASLGNLIFNAVLILALVLFRHFSALTVLAWAIPVAAVLRLTSQIIQIISLKLPPTSAQSTWRFSPEITQRFARSVGSGVALLLLPVGARQLASLQGPGAISVITYAIKIMELPMGMFLASFPVVMFARFSELSASANRRMELAAFAQRSFLRFIGLAFALAIGLSLTSLAAAQFGISWRQFSAEELRKLLLVASILLLSLPAQSANMFATALLNSIGNYIVPFAANATALVGIFLYSALFQPPATPYGIATALVAFFLATAAFQLNCLNRRDFHLFRGPKIFPKTLEC